MLFEKETTMGKKELNLAQLDKVNGGSAIDETDLPGDGKNIIPQKKICYSAKCKGTPQDVIVNSGGRLVCKGCGKPIDEFQHSPGFLPGL